MNRIKNEKTLQRFKAAQRSDYAEALKEIKAGQKRTHWMWYVFPQIVGLGMSSMAHYYEIQSLEEAKAYMKDSYLRNHLLEISKALVELEVSDPEVVMGFPDNLKLCSCMTLFEYIAPDETVFGQVLDKFYDSKRDEKTLNIIEEME